MLQKKRTYWLSDIYFNESTTKIKFTNIDTGEEFIHYLNEKSQIESYFEYLSLKDIHTIGILQGIEFTKISSSKDSVILS
jgi:hypothetical protein